MKSPLAVDITKSSSGFGDISMAVREWWRLLAGGIPREWSPFG
jgi:hypothetical protein